MGVHTREFFSARGRMFGFLLADAAVMALAYFSAFLLRFDFRDPWWGWPCVAYSFISVWAIQAIALALCGCYKLIWRYVSVSDLPRFAVAVGFSTLVFLLLRWFFPNSYGFRPPYSITFFNSFLVFGGLLAARVLVRLVVENGRLCGAAVGGKRVLMVGAGSAGDLVTRELRRQPGNTFTIVGFLDDDVAKQSMSLQGVRVLGKLEDLPEVVRRYHVEEVIVSMARVPRNVIRRVVMLCEQSRVPSRIVPGYYELINGTLTASRIRNLDVADLLGRDESHPDTSAVVELLSGRRVLVTGAGGSIGSELCRQILRTGPAMLVALDQSEFNLYTLRGELGAASAFIPVLADINDMPRLEAVFARYRPEIVIHAAAYKHVPMMELNPVEALENNVLGTRRLGELSRRAGVQRFVLISTDKAVNPVSVMGASKRLAEIAAQDLNTAATRFSAVRFGNVLDSSGSVVPLFREQIRKGVAVTVTHPDMKRYFMTISEAVSLVLQAAALAAGGEIFVLDMGEPIRILELAEEMIALSGLRPYEDIPIRFTGIRPGEKLFEELDVSERSAYRTGHARIFVSRLPKPEPAAVQEMLARCEALIRGCAEEAALREATLALTARFLAPAAPSTLSKHE